MSNLQDLLQKVMNLNLLKNNLKAYFNFLDRNKLYTAINVFGLSVSLMFVILIGNFATNELFKDLHLDKGLKNRTFVIADSHETYLLSGFHVARQMKEKFPQIEQACYVSEAIEFAIENSATKEKFTGTTTFADSSFFNMFNVKLIEGVRDNMLKYSDKVAISRSFAEKMFKDENPIGKSITIIYRDWNNQRETKDYTIDGVFEDFGNSVFKHTDILAAALEIGNYDSSIIGPRMSNWGWGNTIIQIREGEDAHKYEEAFFKHFTENYWPYQNMEEDGKNCIKAMPLGQVYFCNYYKNTFTNGNLEQLIILIIAGAIILVFAILNYINLTVSQTAFRAKEMATRRLLGVTRSSIFWKSILESALLTVVTFILGSLFALAAEPSFNSLIGTEISVFKGISNYVLLTYISLVIFTAFASGIAPAAIMAKAQPISVVKGEFGFKSKNIYGKIIIILQNCITIIFLCMVITVNRQINHMISAPLNHNIEDIYDLKLAGEKMRETMSWGIRDSLLKTPFVEEIGFGMGTPLEGGNNWTITLKEGNRKLSFSVFGGDPAYFNILGFKFKKENNLATKGWYFTEYAMNQMGVNEDVHEVKLETPEGYRPFKRNVAGIIEDFVIKSVLRDKEAAMLYKVESLFPASERAKIYKEAGSYISPWQMLIKVNNTGRDPYATMQEIKDIITSITKDNSAEYLTYCPDRHKLKYSQERTTQTIISIFTVIAIIISSLGLLAMSAYYTQQQKKSIAVKKIFGATTGSVLKQTIMHFMTLVGVSFVIATPIAYWMAERWLQGYNYRIEISPMIFILSGVFTAIIAFAAIYWQSHRAACANPAETTKS